MPPYHQLTRRRFLQAGALAALGSLLPEPLLAAVGRPDQQPRQLALYNIHTNEKLELVYSAAGHYHREALARISHLLRDHRSGAVHPIEPALLDLLHAISQRLPSGSPIHVISGYRSPDTNAKLRKTSSGIARRSLHMQGRAADIRIPGCRLATLQQVALDLGQGGVGFYPDSNFVHVDTGRVRRW